MKTIKYLFLSAILIGFVSCESDDDSSTDVEPLPALTAGTADLSSYVSIGNSLTAGFTDGALFMASQGNSFPNILSNRFAMLGGGAFTQPLMNDNFGGLALAGNRIANPRLVFGGSTPVPLESLIGPVTVSTDIAFNNPTGPFNNMGVPGAASFHLIAPGYGNIGNLPAAANPYYVRMTGTTPDATIMEMAMAQSPSFVTLWIGANDVLGYALGGASSGAPTPQPTFDFAMGQIMTGLGGVQGVMANIPNISDLPYFTTVTHDVIPLDAATANVVNGAYAPYNGGLLQAESFSLITAEERAARTIVFTESSNNAVVIEDESLTDLSGLGLPSYRQATANDLLTLPGATFIGTEAVPGNPLTVNGVAIPLADQWVLVPSEQAEISMAINGYNGTIQASASAAGFGFVDANSIFQQMATGGYTDGDYTLTASLVTGGAVSLDGVHPTSRGYALVANEFMKAIDAAYGSNFEASGNLVDIGNYPTNYSPLLQ